MKTKTKSGTILATIILLGLIAPLAKADTLDRTDFEQESFAKTVDYMEYVRAYATLHGIPQPANFNKWHANMYMTYVNTSGLKLLYAGLEDITKDETSYLRIPMQSFIMHYKTNENNRDVILASTFLMLMAFNETTTSLYPDSPDRNDVLYASFSLGFDLSDLGETLPVLNSETETIPLTHEGNQWTWGMKYTNLTALWWRTWIDPNNPRFDNSWPVALTVYDELTFTYTLTIDPDAGTATLQENHVIGRMRHLFVGIIPVPLLCTYYNSTGHYGTFGRIKLDDNTIHDFIQDNNLKMSIINFQTKKTYKLYNYTADPTESTFDTYESKARTAKITGYAGNGGLFAYHLGLMKFLPAVVVHMYPALVAKAVSTITNMSRANYFYTIAYPEYRGYRVEHDPTFTAYIATNTDTSATPPPTTGAGGGLIIVAVIIVAVGIGIAVFIARRKT